MIVFLHIWPSGKLRLAAILALCTFPATLSVAQSKGSIDPLLATFVVEQQKSLSRLDFLEVSLDLHIWFENSGVIVEHIAEVNQKHAPHCMYVDAVRQTTERNGTVATTSPEDTSARFLVGSEYAIYWLRRGLVAEMWEYKQRDGLPRPARLIRRVDMEGDFIRNFGFGTLNFEFKQLLEPTFSDRFRYVVEPVSEGTYEISLFLRDGVGPEVNHPVQTIRIDLGQGCLITHSLMFDPDGRAFREIVVEGGEIAPDVWFPVSALLREFSYDNNEGGKDVGRTTMLKQYKARDVKISGSFEPDTFTWKGMGFPAEIKVYRTDVLGEKRVLVVENGELVPEDLAIEKREQ